LRTSFIDGRWDIFGFITTHCIGRRTRGIESDRALNHRLYDIYKIQGKSSSPIPLRKKRIAVVPTPPPISISSTGDFRRAVNRMLPAHCYSCLCLVSYPPSQNRPNPSQTKSIHERNSSSITASRVCIPPNHYFSSASGSNFFSAGSDPLEELFLLLPHRPLPYSLTLSWKALSRSLFLSVRPSREPCVA